ncbi:hypothetical protein A0257_02925 [Hymenobacter psoromatis]|nr:hypothetical protein A0257_02925 [Hymenobacter psoromatis]
MARVDNGPKLISHLLQTWCQSQGIEVRCIQPDYLQKVGVVLSDHDAEALTSHVLETTAE